MRECSGCTLCCKLMPMSAKGNERAGPLSVQMQLAGLWPPNLKIAPDFDKPAGVRCPHQRHGKGCNIYLTRPFGCRMWFCRWLINDDMDDCSRPDRVHYVVDINPDFVVNDGQTIKVVQVWLDRDYPNAHRDPKLRAFMERRARLNNYATLVRTNNESALLVIPPAMANDGQWHEIQAASQEHEHTHEEKMRAGLDVTVMMQ